MRFSRNISITIICIILGIMLSWQYKSIESNKKVSASQTKNLYDLQKELLEEKKNNENLRARNQELAAQVSEYIDAAGNNKKIEDGIREQLTRARMLAGLVDVEGPGIEITLDDGDLDYETVYDIDLLKLINELRAAEAQAISINGERIVAMTEIRYTDPYMVINGRQIYPPYIIKAIAEPEKLDYALNMLGGIIEIFRDSFGYKISVNKVDRITIPKVRDDGSVLKYNLLNPL
ncbi:DUF881 domain-containing protein [Acetivibrio mesophilus]|uniref:DUF881 domain-containing protein n=1 Tax=Acetivibrio mesophilus TaxID=2487273 RepID=A0A4Q0I6D3_9FIRM|nr:DUF881 domain-containing protein [Acetivibrio mesophilus]ODM25087.1 hypothetical protein A7W90_01975 [Clostridium sp. Bc-iso-3]RXE59911.1 DUF881 domain-containing protein [Acetivibrio mesophilus]HHV29686.1 DUF881 domain-containing protein [Clostridium sp.]